MSMTKIRKWLVDSVDLYKHKNQKARDYKLIKNGFNDCWLGLFCLCIAMYGLVNNLIVWARLQKDSEQIPLVKDLAKEIAKNLILETRRFLIGLAIIVCTPVLILRIGFRLFQSGSGKGRTVFLNRGLKKIVIQCTVIHENAEGIYSLLVQKSAKYSLNEQRDCEKLEAILQNMQLTLSERIFEVQDKILQIEQELTEEKDMNATHWVP